MRLHRTPFRSVLRLSLVAALAAFAGCVNLSGGDDGTPAAGTIIVLASNQTPSVGVNVTSSQVVRIVRSAGYDGAVGLSVDSLPTGVTATFDPAVLGGLGTISILTLTATTGAVPATKLVTIKATGQNAPVDSTNLSLTVVTGALDLTSAATSVTVPQGANGTVPLVINRSNGFLGSVALSVEGLPSSVTATFSPALLPNGSVTTTLSLGVTPGTAPATIPLTIRAKGTGVADKTVPLQLVIAPSTAVEFALSASLAAQSLVAGTTGPSVTVNIVRTGGFAANVGLGLSALPAGVSGVITPNPTNPNAPTLTFAATTAAIPGDYTIVLTGTAGAITHSIPLSLRITAAPAIAVSLVPDSLRILPSGAVQSAVIMTRVGGFTGDFTMTATGVPTGVTASFGSTVVTGTATSLSFVASAAVTPGVYHVVVKATAGSDSGTATLVLTVGTAASN